MLHFTKKVIFTKKKTDIKNQLFKKEKATETFKNLA